MSLRKGWSTRNVWPILSFANFVNILLKYTFNLFLNKFSSFVVLSSFYIYIYIYIMKEPNFCTIKAQELVSQELQPLIED